MLKSVNRKVALFLAAVAILFIFLSFQLPSYPYTEVDADIVPKGLGFLLLICSVLMFFNNQEETEAERKKREIPRDELLMLLAVFGIILVYIFLLELIGFVIMTILFIFFTTWFLGYKKLISNLAVSVTFSLVIYLLFSYLLQINLPAGILPI